MPTRTRDTTRGDIIRALAAATGDEAAKVRTAALEVLGWAGWTGPVTEPDERAVLMGAVLPALQAENPEIRRAATDALRAFGQAPTEAVPILLRLLTTDSVARVRSAAAFALGRAARTSATVLALVKALRDRDRSVRASAADALAMLGAARDATPRLVVARRVSEPWPVIRTALDAQLSARRPALSRLRRRLAAVIRKARVSPEDDADPVDLLLGMPCENEVKDLVTALGPDAAPFLPSLMEFDQSFFGRFDADDALASTGPAGAKELLHSLREGSAPVRKGTAAALASFTDVLPEVVPGLIAAATDSDPSVRASATWSLAHALLRRAE
jgi:HEAT repeat protein